MLYKETIKMLILSKRKSLGELMFLFNGSVSFNEHAFFDFKNEIIISICQDCKLLKRRDIATI